jgi:hypothetical protein
MLAGLISSAVDVDKIAYLVGDSHFTGVSYGRGIDVWGYFRTLRVPPFETLDNGGVHPVIAIDERGLKAIESIISARFSMLERVYWHAKNRAMMAMFKHAIHSLFAHGPDRPPLTFSEYFADVFWHDNKEAAQYLSARLTGDHADDLNGLEHGGRLTCRELLTVARHEDRDLWDAMTGEVTVPADEHVTGIGPTKSPAELAAELEEVVAGELADRLAPTLRPGDVLIDVPWKGRDKIRPDEVIVLPHTDPRPTETGWRTLREASETIGELGEEFLNGAKKCRVFLKPAIAEILIRDDRVDTARLAAAEALRVHFQM